MEFGPNPSERAELVSRAASERQLKNEQNRLKAAARFIGKSADEVLRSFLVQREGSILRAWRNHLDPDHEHTVSLGDFLRSMRCMRYAGDARQLFKALDADYNLELSLSEIDAAQGLLWEEFCLWGASLFRGSEEFFRSIPHVKVTLPSVGRNGDTDKLTLVEFTEGIRMLGWSGGSEECLFTGLDTRNAGTITMDDMNWLDREGSRTRAMERAKRKVAEQYNPKKCLVTIRENMFAKLAEFKQFIKQMFGGFLRAWREGLACAESMVIPKSQFKRSCNRLGWSSDVESLWNALDMGGSGHISFVDFDEREAVPLAKFIVFMRGTFTSKRKRGGNFTHAAIKDVFQALKKSPEAVKVHRPEFVERLQQLGFKEPTKKLFHGLDLYGKNYLVESDLWFLDRWRPQPFMFAGRNNEAVDVFKELLLKRFKSFLKGWRHLLDRNGTNHCNWHQFDDACKFIGHTMDPPGTWRALDQNRSGFLTLIEIDPEANNLLVSFKKWVDNGFGNVRSFFGSFLEPGECEISRAGFCRACRVYRFDADPRPLFECLDTDRTGTLSVKQVTFLDNWLMEEEGETFIPRPTSCLDGADPDLMGPRRTMHFIFENEGTLGHIPNLEKFVGNPEPDDDSDSDEDISLSGGVVKVVKLQSKMKSWMQRAKTRISVDNARVKDRPIKPTLDDLLGATDASLVRTPLPPTSRPCDYSYPLISCTVEMAASARGGALPWKRKQLKQNITLSPIVCVQT